MNKKKAPITIVKENFANFANDVLGVVKESPHGENCNARLGYACNCHKVLLITDIGLLFVEHNVPEREGEE
mgnify:CR=1 FL=1